VPSWDIFRGSQTRDRALRSLVAAVMSSGDPGISESIAIENLTTAQLLEPAMNAYKATPNATTGPHLRQVAGVVFGFPSESADAFAFLALIDGGAPTGPAFGTFGPAAPTLGALTLAQDFDLAYEPLGAMRAEIPVRAGTDAAAFMHPFSGGLQIVSMGGTRRALRFVAADTTAARILSGATPWNVANASVTLVAVVHRRTAGADHVIIDLSNGTNSGDNVDTLNRYKLRFSAANAAVWGRADGSGVVSASMGTPIIGRNIIVCRANLAGDNINRGTLNGAAKVSSTARSVTQAQFSQILLGAQGLWQLGTSAYSLNQAADTDLERLLVYTGAASDAELDAAYAWANTGYP
jgi:hypothetical protein